MRNSDFHTTGRCNRQIHRQHPRTLARKAHGRCPAIAEALARIQAQPPQSPDPKAPMPDNSREGYKKREK